MRLALIGCGLIGASAAWSMRLAGVVDSVVAYNRHFEGAQKAVELGIADKAVYTIREAVEGADAVLVAVPVKVMYKIFAQVANFLGPKAYVTDVGSVRGSVVADAREAFAEAFPRYCPVHPIAGGEKMGIDAARADLFNGANAICTPLPETDPQAVQLWEHLWAATGSNIIRMSVAEHDSIFASVSHLPHVLSYALVDMVCDMPDSERRLALTGGGFRDFTRIAASSPVMWRDICLANREQLLENIDLYMEKLNVLRQAVADSDAARMDAIFTRAATVRRNQVYKIK